MKIGIDGRFWNATGVGRYTRNLVRELQKLDKKNDYILFVNQDDFTQVYNQLSNNKFHIKIVDIKWHTFSEQLQYPRILLREQIDLMHFPYFSLPLFYPRPFVVTIHDLILHHYTTGKTSTLPLPLYYGKLLGYKFLVQQSAKRAKKIITVSESTKREIMNHLHISEQKIVVTYEGIDTSLRGSTKENIYGKYFLHVGNVYPHKNTLFLIEAFTKTNLQDVILLFVGKRDYFMKQLEKEVRKKGLDNKVLFLGSVDDTQLAALYKHALATVVPSLMEGFGLPVVEAMANNCLVIASDIPSLREVGQNAVLYFNPFNKEELSDILYSVAQNSSEFKDKKEEGIKLVGRYSWKKMAEQTLAVYESCISL